MLAVNHADTSAVYAHGEIVGVVAAARIEKGHTVVSTRRAHAVSAAGSCDQRAARAITYRRDIEPVELACWRGRQENVQPRDFDLEFGKTESAPASRTNYRRCCAAAGDQRATGTTKVGAASNFPDRAGNVGVLQIIGEDFRYSPPGAGHVEIVIHTGELAGAQGGVPLVSEAVHQIKVAVIPKWARRCRSRCWYRCRRSGRCRCWCGCQRTDYSADYAHGIVVGLTLIGRVLEGGAKEVTVEERVRVVATGRAHTGGTAGGRVKGKAREVPDRGDIEPVELACRQGRQENVHPRDLDLEFGIPEPAPAGRGNYRRCCHAAGHQGAACVKQGGAISNFPRRADYDGILQIVGEDGGYIPPAAGHIKIVIHTGELAGAERGVLLISQAVDEISVAVIPNSVRRGSRR